MSIFLFKHKSVLADHILVILDWAAAYLSPYIIPHQPNLVRSQCIEKLYLDNLSFCLFCSFKFKFGFFHQNNFDL